MRRVHKPRMASHVQRSPRLTLKAGRKEGRNALVSEASNRNQERRQSIWIVAIDALPRDCGLLNLLHVRRHVGNKPHSVARIRALYDPR